MPPLTLPHAGICDTSSLVSGSGSSLTCSESDAAGAIHLGKKSVFGVPFTSTNDLSAKPVVLCASSCPSNSPGSSANQAGVSIACYTNNNMGQFFLANASSLPEQVVQARAMCGAQATLFATSNAKDVFGYCVPEGAVNATMSSFESTINAALGGASWTTAIDSIDRGKWGILGLAFAAMIIGFMYLCV